jgi:hypothetical protein
MAGGQVRLRLCVGNVAGGGYGGVARYSCVARVEGRVQQLAGGGGMAGAAAAAGDWARNGARPRRTAHCGQAQSGTVAHASKARQRRRDGACHREAARVRDPTAHWRDSDAHAGIVAAGVALDTRDGAMDAQDRHRRCVGEAGGGKGDRARWAVLDTAAEKSGPERSVEEDGKCRWGGGGMVPCYHA